jgi:aminopeptidase N
MYVVSGLPQILLIQTVAHEWAHAWQGENCPLLRDPLVREGFAEWVAYKTLQRMGASKKMALMEQQDGLYGQGLQKMLELERRGGLSGVLAFCRRAE